VQDDDVFGLKAARDARLLRAQETRAKKLLSDAETFFDFTAELDRHPFLQRE
jgi:hypothetical protein